MTQQSHSQTYTLRKPKLKKTHVSHCSMHHNLQQLEQKQPRCPSIDEWINKQWYIYTMEYYSAIKRNVFESVLMRQMNLEPIIQSKVSQKKINIIFQCIYIYRIQKNGSEEFINEQQCRNRHREQNYGHGERGGEGEMYEKSNMETYIIICKIDSQWEFSI